MSSGVPWDETYFEHDESKWTHLICVTDWNRMADKGETHTHIERKDYPHYPENEAWPCCWCGELTRAGIYYRADPVEVHG